MRRKGKWISVESPDQPVTDVARQALDKRLSTVWRCLPLAAHKADDDIEYVHQLRVASRRAMAAIEIFESFLPKHRAAWFKRQLKRVRNAAGDARDFDVLAARMRAAVKESAHSEPIHPKPASTDHSDANRSYSNGNGLHDAAPADAGPRIAAPLVDEEHRRAAEKFLGWIERRRHDEQPAIVKIHDRLKDRDFKHRVEKLCGKIRPRDGSTAPVPFSEVARDQIAHVVDEFFTASRADLILQR